jgi:hypothetical protein
MIRRHFAMFSLPLSRPFLTQRKTLHIYSPYSMSASIPGLLCNVMIPAQEYTTQHVRYTSCSAQVWEFLLFAATQATVYPLMNEPLYLVRYPYISLHK